MSPALALLVVIWPLALTNVVPVPNMAVCEVVARAIFAEAKREGIEPPNLLCVPAPEGSLLPAKSIP